MLESIPFPSCLWFVEKLFEPTTIIAIIVAYIAYKQYQIQKHRIKMDLFEKRWAAYTKGTRILYFIAMNGKNAQNPHLRSDYEERLSDLHSCLHDAYFLFGEDINNYLNEIRTKVEKFLAIKSESEIDAVVNYCIDQLSLDNLIVMEKFKPYLKINAE